jgi:beta-galactosidase
MKLVRSIACFAKFALGISTMSLTATTASSQAGPEAKIPLYLGTAWYPEQWPEARWDEDLTLIEKAHVQFVRITEFAWSTIERSEGHYDLDWIERAIRMAEKHHIAVVLGTDDQRVRERATYLREAGSVWSCCVEQGLSLQAHS